jgi:hypothetical protein
MGISGLLSSPTTESHNEDPQDMHGIILKMMNQSSVELDDFQLILESLQHKIDSKSFLQISKGLESLHENSKKTSKAVQSHQVHINQYKEQVTNAFQMAESAFMACLADNNSIRKKFGLDPVQASQFLPAGYENRTILSSLGLHDRRTSQATSLDEFYDAEPGVDSSSDSSSSIFSESQKYRDSSFTESQKSNDTRSLNRSLTESRISHDTRSILNRSLTHKPNHLSLKQSFDVDSILMDESFESHIATSNPQNPDNTSNSQNADTDNIPDRTELKPLKRRTRLPHPTVSMETVNIMSILRNNVGKDLSKVASNLFYFLKISADCIKRAFKFITKAFRRIRVLESFRASELNFRFSRSVTFNCRVCCFWIFFFSSSSWKETF